MGLGHGAQWVHLNLYFRSLGLHEAAIGRILSMGALGTVLMAVPAALWIDRLPAQRVFGTAAIGFALLFATQLVADRTWILTAAALGTGMLFTIHWVAAAPFFMRNAIEEDRIYLFGFANATETLATVISAAAGGACIRLLTARLGSELLGLRYTLLGIAAIALLAAVFFLQIRDAAPSTERRSLRHYLVAKDARLLGKLTLPGFLVGLGAGLIIPFLNLYFRDRFGQDPRQIGGFFAVSQFLTVLGFLAGAPLARRLGSVRVIVLTELLSIPFFCAIAFSYNLPLAVFAFWMRGALMNMNGPVSSNFAMEVVPEDQRTVTNSVRMLAWNGSWMVSTQLGGWVIQRHGYTPPMLATIGLYAISAVLFYGFFRGHRQVGQAATA
jgi:predicted MFS family arabinose efflux permease